MNKKQQTKLTIVLSVILILGVALSLVLYALKQNINLFYTPTQLVADAHLRNVTVRLGGYVEKNSVHYSEDGTQVQFLVSDQQAKFAVSYKGLLPTLFREGQGVVMTGKLTDAKQFVASEILAKHDEKYMPKNYESKLRKRTA